MLFERAYWTTYYSAQARIVPMSEEEQRNWVESRMRPLYELLGLTVGVIQTADKSDQRRLGPRSVPG